MKLEDLSEITLMVNGEALTLDIEKEFSLERTSLEKVPAKLGYIVALHYRVLKALQDKRLAKDQYYATQFSIIKSDFDGSRPPSDEATKNEIMDDPKYITKLKAYNKAQANFELVNNLLEAFKIRTEVLRTLSANRRKEMQSEF